MHALARARTYTHTHSVRALQSVRLGLGQETCDALPTVANAHEEARDMRAVRTLGDSVVPLVQYGAGAALLSDELPVRIGTAEAVGVCADSILGTRPCQYLVDAKPQTHGGTWSVTRCTPHALAVMICTNTPIAVLAVLKVLVEC